MLWINAIDEISAGPKVTLRGWIANFFIMRFRIKNLCLEFYYEGNKIGETRTDRLGRFYFDTEFEKPGTHQIFVKIKDFYSLDTIIHVLRIDPKEEKSILVCDIDNTLVQFSVFAFLMRITLNEIEGSRETLDILKDKYHIVYLTHRERRLSNLTKRWLLNHHYPPSPVFFWSAKEDPFSSRKYKKSALKRIKEKACVPLAVGIGDKPGDMEAYNSIGIPKIFPIKASGDWKKVKEFFTHEF